VNGLTAVLRGGDGRAAAATWERLRHRVQLAGVPGRLVGADARVDHRPPGESIDRAIAALRTAGPGTSDLINV
jgi:hypothetical protein